MSTGKPVLALVSLDGIQAELLSGAGTGAGTDYHDIGSIQSALRFVLDPWNRHGLTPRREYIEQFSRRRLTAFLSELLNEIAGVPPQANV